MHCLQPPEREKLSNSILYLYLYFMGIVAVARGFRDIELRLKNVNSHRVGATSEQKGEHSQRGPGVPQKKPRAAKCGVVSKGCKTPTPNTLLSTTWSEAGPKARPLKAPRTLTPKLHNHLQLLVYHVDPEPEEQTMAQTHTPADDIFNTRYFGREPSSPAPGPDVGFPLFAQLPRELRLQIWTWHLTRRRFLRVLLEESAEPDPEVLPPYSASQPGSGPCHGLSDDDEWAPFFAAGPEDPDAEVTRDAAGSSETEIWPESVGPTAPPLRVTFLGAPIPAMPALRLVCREALDAHNSVYRVRLPALARIPYGDGSRDYTTARIVAHLNPELDILSLQMRSPAQLVFRKLVPLFLHHVLQHDFSPGSLRLGARHLCVSPGHLGSDYHDDGADGAASLAPHVLASVRLTVTHLRGLYLRLTTAGHREPRVMSGPLVNARSVPWYNASVPVLPSTSWGPSSAVEPARGDRGGDPRLAGPEGAADLRQVWIGRQLRPSLEAWAGLERAWGVTAGGGSGGAGTRVRALVGLDAEGWAEQTSIGSKNGLGAYLREERAAWESLTDPALEMGGMLRRCFQAAQQAFLPGLPAVTPEEWICRRQPHTAVGFWLIDPDALEAAETTGHTGKKIVNLSERGAENIELWVFRGHSEGLF